MDDNLELHPRYDRRVLLVALSCLLLSGSRNDRDLKVLFLLAQETFAKGKDRVRMTMRQLVPGARSTIRNVMEALDRLTADGLVIRDREPGATGASHYSINVVRLLEVAEAYDDARRGVVVLPAAWAKSDAVPVVRKRTRRAA